MDIIEEAYATLNDLKLSLETEERIGCHTFVFSAKTRKNKQEWQKIDMDGKVADQMAATMSSAMLAIEARAADDQALVEFNFDAMADRSIGTLKLNSTPSLEEWVKKIPGDDWPIRFDGDVQTLDRARFYVTRLNFPDKKHLLVFRGSRGLTITLNKQGVVAAAFSRAKHQMVAVEGPIVSFDNCVDFAIWENMVFVVNMRTFESITNIRDVTIQKANEVIDLLGSRFDLGSDTEKLKTEINKRTILAKRLAAAHYHGIIDDIDAQKLVERAQDKNLRVKCKLEKGKAIFNINYDEKGEIEDFVDLLTDLFLNSPVTGREWEALVKRTPRNRR
ncbi:MAG: hypothetical protein DI601_20570 [Azospirillum brasilense]|nr:MAG: hypothetical protein DI601_20570 [Azospirillum brasilense]